VKLKIHVICLWDYEWVELYLLTPYVFTA
jgi:hypothetical protein